VIEAHGVRAVLTDIEGTTTSLAFVREQLFPYARRCLPAYVREHEAELREIAAEIESLMDRRRLTSQQMIEILLQWMDEDRKVPPLKTLQGMIWRSGYACGEIVSHVYEDAERALRRWHDRGIRNHVYSSGSIEAQKLLFSHTSRGDLTGVLAGYFDTTIGAKLESPSYERIASVLELPAPSLVFLSDHPGETRAAAAAGLQTILVARDHVDDGTGPSARTFDDIRLEM
jgi:enolase-phosphatase E1